MRFRFLRSVAYGSQLCDWSAGEHLKMRCRHHMIAVQLTFWMLSQTLSSRKQQSSRLSKRKGTFLSCIRNTIANAISLSDSGVRQNAQLVTSAITRLGPSSSASRAFLMTSPYIWFDDLVERHGDTLLHMPMALMPMKQSGQKNSLNPTVESAKMINYTQ